MGSVWVAHNELVNAEVALKVLLPDGARAGGAAARFRHEARVGSRLRHRSITRVFDLVEEPDGSLLLVMELLSGQTLEARLREGRLAPEEAVAVAVPILSALDHAHKEGVLHRDVKPGNVYLSVEPDGQMVPKLLDFGIAKGTTAEEQGSNTADGEVLGTPGYMSPEQIRADAGAIDGRSDLFAMGAVLYEMMTGAPPFNAAAPSARLAAVLEQEVDPDPSIPPALWIEVRRALSKRPAERHATAAEMAMALGAAIGMAEADLVKVLRTAPPPPQRRSHRTADGIGATVPPRPATSPRLRWLGLALVGVAVVGAALVTSARISSPPAAAPSSALPPTLAPPAPSAPPIPDLPSAPATTAAARPPLSASAPPARSKRPPRAQSTAATSPAPVPEPAPVPAPATSNGFAPNPGF